MTLKSGLLVLHGNRLETLAEVVFEWLARNPLAPLQEESVLVQSNGMAEWFKMNLAASQGVCAATRVELPARFLWRVYRAVLGRPAVPSVLVTDKQPLVWRLMVLLPQWLQENPDDASSAPLRAALRAAEAHATGSGPAHDSALRRLVLCQRMADLFDQYQVYRPDWLEDWAAGRDVLRSAPWAQGAREQPVPAEQRWQPAVWRAMVARLQPHERHTMRPVLHQRCLQSLSETAHSAGHSAWPELPQRVVLFGSSQLPYSTLELLCALADHVQVILAVPNPCRYFWADLIDGREQLALARRRHPLRSGVELSALPLQSVQAHGHPLLASWGRQARDFVRQLDVFDDVRRSRDCFELPRVDLFDDSAGQTLLQQVQARIRDGVPMQEHQEQPLADDDASIVFHSAHSPQREVEVLHDQLLHLLARPPGGLPLNPRDMVVMVPDIENFAPAIRSVFGQFPRGHARHIPWGIADVHERRHNPLLQAVEWLMRVPQHRFTLAEWRDLLELPACAARFGIQAEDLPMALSWLAGAGVRWGLHQQQRDSLDLQAAGEVASWRFGLQRLLLGYAAGELEDGFDGIEPYTEVAGLSAGLAGTLAHMARELDQWWHDAQPSSTPEMWAPRLRSLLQTFFLAQDDADRAAIGSLDDALGAWLLACEAAGFREPVPLAVVREAWLGGLQEPGAAQRFKAGGVTFCTLLPLRAIPFEVVCLLGMNEGDYPRAVAAADLDLMAVPGMGRPGDRSRRHDDRQLMLDALLSARRVLHISWCGRSQRDNTAQSPSVLVAQLRDYLDTAWGPQTCARRTVEHPLQPFSRRYFEASQTGPAQLFTYAAEWRQAHDVASTAVAPQEQAEPASGAEAASGGDQVLTLAQLAAFLRNPVRFYYRWRLKVVFGETGLSDLQADESFGDSGLERTQWLQDLLNDAQSTSLEQALRRLQRQGRLPLAGPGQHTADQLRAMAQPMLAEAERVSRALPKVLPALAIELDAGQAAPIQLRDTVTGLFSDDDGENLVAIQYVASALKDKAGDVRPDKLLAMMLCSLACAAAGRPAQWLAIGTDAVAAIAPPDPLRARHLLQDLLLAAHQSLSQSRPLATAVRTGMTWLTSLEKTGDDQRKANSAARLVYDGGEFAPGWAEGQEPCLQRTFARFDQLAGDQNFETDTRRLYGPLLELIRQQLQLDDLTGTSAEADSSDD